MFNRATIALTIKYSIVAISMVWLVSLGVYLYMNKTFGGDYIRGLNVENQNGRPDAVERISGATEAADAGLNRLRSGLLIINGGLVVIVPLLSFYLARQTLKPLAESYEAQQRFVDDASHELRTPLSIIIGELELALSKKRNSDNYRQSIAVSLEQVNRVSQLIKNLLYLARGNEALLRAEFRKVNISRLVSHCETLLEPELIRKNIRLTNNIAEDILPIQGNELLLEQLIRNVLDNAIKFSPSGRDITLSVNKTKHGQVITVTDQGVGMSAVEISHVFDRFWRAEGSRSTNGHGLGLAISKQIAVLHGGTIELQSRLGVGTTLKIMLPNNGHSS